MLSFNARTVFTGVYMQCMSESHSTLTIYDYKCKSGCFFRETLKKIAIATFNIKAKNFVREEKDKIHEAKCKKKKRTTDDKDNPTGRKIKKVTG